MQWLKNFVNSFFDLLVSAFSVLWELFREGLKLLFFFFYDGFLSLVTAIVTAVDFGVLGLNTVLDWSNLPPQMLYVIGQIGLQESIVIIVSAITIRMTLNLIPASLTRI
jgi:hypothetical protein